MPKKIIHEKWGEIKWWILNKNNNYKDSNDYHFYI